MMPSNRPCTSPLRRMVTRRAAKPQAASVPIAYSAVVIPALGAAVRRPAP